MAVVDVVKCNFAPNVFAWKFPSDELSSWTQLIVNESQEAIMFKEGRSVGPFPAGRHTLSSDNYPLLHSLLKIPFGKSPYTAEVWFIQKAFSLDVKWGFPVPIQLEDPKYHIMLPVRAFGQYGITVEDSAKFLIKLHGTLPAYTQKTLSSYFKGIIITEAKNLIAEYLIQNNISILHIGAKLNEISDALQQKISMEIEDYGVKIVNFKVNSINTDDNDRAVKKLKEVLASKLEMDILGFNYQQKRSFDAMEAAAGNNAGGGVMNAGIGLGMGMGLGIPMGNMAQQMSQNFAVTSKNVCQKCGADNPANSKFCTQCAALLKPEQTVSQSIKCDKCGSVAAPGSKFCPNCGDVFFLCPVCGTDNPKEAEVCVNCKAQLPVKCSSCGALNSSSVMYCSECGNLLGHKCPACGKLVAGNKKFCPDCGTRIDGDK